MKRFLIIVIISIAAILAFSCISCHYKMSEGGAVVPHTEVIKNQHYYDSVMDAFLNRMDGQKELSNRDIADICDFSLHNLDASLSETIGYELFHLLRNNPTNQPRIQILRECSSIGKMRHTLCINRFDVY